MVTLEQVLEKARTGYLTPFEAAAMVTVAKMTPVNGNWVNIGAGAGTSALAIAAGGVSLDRIYTVDINEDGGPYGGLKSERNAFEECGLSNHPIQLLGDSYVVGIKKASEISAWGLFIDADHTADGLSRDIAAWIEAGRVPNRPHFILFHDYGSPNWPDVKEVVDRWASWTRLQEWAHVDSLKIFF